MHIAPEHLGPWPFRAEVAPFSIVASTTAWIVHAVLEMHPLIPNASMSARGGSWHPLGWPRRRQVGARTGDDVVLAGYIEWYPQPPQGGAFPLSWMKTALTASSPEACLVVLSSSSFLVFG
jgi:hypothetical protein